MKRKREEKYPDTETFHFHNENPKGKFTTDCVIRAIAKATEIPYETVLREMAEMQIKIGYDMSDTKGYNKYLESKGWHREKQPRKIDNTKYTGNEFCKEIQDSDGRFYSYRNQNIIANVGSHHIVAICEGKIFDTWNSGYGAVGKYWVK